MNDDEEPRPTARSLDPERGTSFVARKIHIDQGEITRNTDIHRHTLAVFCFELDGYWWRGAHDTLTVYLPRSLMAAIVKAGAG